MQTLILTYIGITPKSVDVIFEFYELGTKTLAKTSPLGGSGCRGVQKSVQSVKILSICLVLAYILGHLSVASV